MIPRRKPHLRPMFRRRRRTSPVHRHAHRLVLWLGSITAALIIVIGFALWRLAQGPVVLDHMAPYVAAALDRTFPGLEFHLAGVGFAFDREARRLDLWGEGVRITTKGGKPLADLPQVLASLSLAALLHGKVEPTRLIVERPVLRLVRTPAGGIDFRFGNYPSLGAAFLGEASGPQAAGSPLGPLRLVAVRDARLVLDDQASGRHWRADRVDATIEPDPEGFAGDLAFALPIGRRLPEFHARYRYESLRRRLDGRFDFGQLVPAALAGFAPRLAPLAALDIPVSGRISARFDLAHRQPEAMRLDLRLGPGSIKTALFAAGRLVLAGGTLAAAYSPEQGELRLERLDLDLGNGAEIDATGRLGGVTPQAIAGAAPLPKRLDGSASVRLAALPFDRIDDLWPRPLAPGARRWARANISAGVLDKAALDFAFGLDPATLSAAVGKLRGTLLYHGFALTCLQGLPPVRDVAGSARLEGQELDITPTGGRLEGLRLSGGRLAIAGLDGAVQRLDAEIGVAGPVADALKLIARPPFNYAGAIGIDAAKIAGTLQGRLRVKLPLRADLPLADVDFALSGRISQLRIADIAFGSGLEEGELALNVGRGGARLEGTAQLAGVPAKIGADVSFAENARPRARYRLALSLDDKARKRLLDGRLPGRIDGPVPLDLTYSLFDGGHDEASAVFDLRQAALALPQAGWRKPPGAPGRAAIDFALAEGRLAGPLRVALSAPGLDGRLALGLGPAAQIERVDISRLAIGQTDVKGSVARLDGGGWRLDLEGPALDLDPVLQEKGEGDLPPLRVEARLGRVILGAGRRTGPVAARLLRSGGEWRKAAVDARLANGRTLKLSLADGSDRRFAFESDDLGATLALFDIAGNVVGGRVKITGRVAENAGKDEISGRIDGTDYRLVRAPVPAQLLSLASFDALRGMLAGSGIPFDRLSGRFLYRGGRLRLQDVVASGSAIGVTATGWTDLSQGSVDLQGTIVPAYLLNSILGNVPVLGSLILGGKGQGLIAASYRLEGPIANPRVTVNPLSALTPGFIRRLWQPNFGLGAPASPQE